MLKTISICFALAAMVYSAEISSSYAMFEKQENFKPDLKTEPVDKGTYKRDTELERHPVYKPDERRAKIEPVKPTGPVVNHDRMLADQPLQEEGTEVHRVDNFDLPGYAYGPVQLEPEQVAYPDVPYAPAYQYGDKMTHSYAYVPDDRLPDEIIHNFPFSIMSQGFDSRSLVYYIGHTIGWILGHAFWLFLGSLITIGVCSYTNICVINYPTMLPIHDEMRSLMSPEKLEKISNAADFVKTAINKYQSIQGVDNVRAVKRRRRAVFL